jgi:hypothetical protein
MINGVGVLAECIEYRNNIGFRVHVNAFGTCTGKGTIISNGYDMYVQDVTDLFKVELETEIDCDSIYSDHWEVLIKLAKCQ